MLTKSVGSPVGVYRYDAITGYELDNYARVEQADSMTIAPLVIQFPNPLHSYYSESVLSDYSPHDMTKIMHRV